MYIWIVECVCVCETLRLGFMRGLYEPPGGCEQQSCSQLSHGICQNIRSITNTNPSAEKHTHTQTLHTVLFTYVVRCIQISKH